MVGVLSRVRLKPVPLSAELKFTSLRQRPQVIYSDNGTNLRAGEQELKEAVDEWIKKTK